MSEIINDAKQRDIGTQAAFEIMRAGNCGHGWYDENVNGFMCDKSIGNLCAKHWQKCPHFKEMCK